ncbi:unnamed protein product [Amoebophrya sp. A120]|nr:unnamed protein product [Amoebophrya sp. A120]|eukprot:GSA120T00008320001.1
MNFVKRETLTTEITDTGVVEKTKRLELTENDQVRDRIAALPEFSRNRITQAETEAPKEQQADEFAERHRFLRQEEERIHSESQAHLKDMREKQEQFHNQVFARQQKDASDFEQGRKKLLNADKSSVITAKIGDTAANANSNKGTATTGPTATSSSSTGGGGTSNNNPNNPRPGDAISKRIIETESKFFDDNMVNKFVGRTKARAEFNVRKDIVGSGGTVTKVKKIGNMVINSTKGFPDKNPIEYNRERSPKRATVALGPPAVSKVLTTTSSTTKAVQNAATSTNSAGATKSKPVVSVVAGYSDSESD